MLKHTLHTCMCRSWLGGCSNRRWHPDKRWSSRGHSHWTNQHPPCLERMLPVWLVQPLHTCTCTCTVFVLSQELARRLQREEVMRHRQLKQQKLAQQRVMSEAEAQKRHTPPMEPTRQQQTFPQPSRSQQPKETKPPPKQVQYSSQTARSSATQSPVHTQGPPQAGNPEQVLSYWLYVAILPLIRCSPPI